MRPGIQRRLRTIVPAAAATLAGTIVAFAPSTGPFRLASVVEEPGVPARPWRLVAGKYWQVARTDGEEATTPDGQVDAGEGAQGACPNAMIDVHGSMKVDGSSATVEELQKEACSAWINRSYPERCAAFDADRWRELSRKLPTRAMHFCIDRYEYPNEKGAFPAIMVTWREAAALCEERGARLCSEDEWTFACEGEEALPFATGYVRDSTACVLDRPWRLVHEQALAERTSGQALREIDALWQGEASGEFARCRSPFGVNDMIGNVDEWTLSTQPSGPRSILKGGYWGPVRTQCRATTRVHDESFYFYQIGFRCCADAGLERDD
jgi:hypothetical protein